MPEKDGQHVLVRQTINNIPTYSWTDAAIIVKVNQALIFEYTPAVTESLEHKFHYSLAKGNYLVTTTVTCYTMMIYSMIVILLKMYLIRVIISK